MKRKIHARSSLRASSTFYVVSEASRERMREPAEKQRGACYSRVTSRDSPKWRACSQANRSVLTLNN